MAIFGGILIVDNLEEIARTRTSIHDLQIQRPNDEIGIVNTVELDKLFIASLEHPLVVRESTPFFPIPVILKEELVLRDAEEIAIRCKLDFDRTMSRGHRNEGG